MRFPPPPPPVLSSFKNDHPYYLATPCIYKWNENNIFNNNLSFKNKLM